MLQKQGILNNILMALNKSMVELKGTTSTKKTKKDIF